MADMYFNTKDRDWGDFYNSLGRTDLSPNPSSVPSGDLTTRSVRTVAIDPYTGQPKVTATPSFQQGMMGRGITSVGSPNLTAAEQQLLSQQIQQSQALQAGYNPDGTPKPLPIRPSWSIPTPVSRPNASPIDQAAYNATKKPGTWLASSRMNAQALMRQMAQRGTVPATVPRAVAIPPAVVATPNANVTAPIKPQSRGGLFELIFGPSKNGMGGLAGLLGGPNAGGIVGALTTQKAATPRPEVNHKAARDSAERSGQTVSGTPSSSGRYYNFDTNSWM